MTRSWPSAAASPFSTSAEYDGRAATGVLLISNSAAWPRSTSHQHRWPGRVRQKIDDILSLRVVRADENAHGRLLPTIGGGTSGRFLAGTDSAVTATVLLRQVGAKVRNPLARKAEGEGDGGPPIVLPLVVLTAVSWTGILGSPWLLDRPLLLIALNPRLVFLLLAAPDVDVIQFTAVATARLVIADPFSYMLGYRYGTRMRSKIERSRLFRWMTRITAVEQTACLIAVWLRPSQPILIWAGSLRIPPLRVAIADVLTTAVYVAFIHQGVSLIW